MSKKNKNLRTPKRKRGGSKALLIVLIVLLVLAIGGMIAYAVIDNMMETPPSVDTNTPWQNDDSNENAVPVKREDGSYNFLVVGRDVVALNTDVMMVVNLDLDDDSMTIMQMPRDTFITIDGAVKKLNSVFGIYYNSSSASGTDGKIHDGMKGLAQTLSSNLAINIDFYAYMNLDGFGAIVDAIGGVDMYVPYRMYYPDPEQNLLIDLYEGQQTLDGDKAEQFVRFRNSYVHGDTGRQDAQKLFMTAFMESFKNKISITNVVPVVTSILNNLEHSLTVSDAAYFVKEAMQMDFSNITMLSAPNTPYTYYGGSYVILHRNAMYKVVNENFNLFDTDIPEASFDKDKNFTLTTDANINAIYNTTEEFEGTHSAEDIQQNGIDVDRAW
ncbi:MAG: LCP family protein [Clostridia bacterium]|nr:LCP family protein [Clostridia bacterium]